MNQQLSFSTPPDNICILRLSALGDATHVLPLIERLQTAWPQTRITWIIGTLEHKLLAGLPGVEFVVFNKRGGFSEVLKLRQHMADREFDVLLHMQVAARANILSRFIKAKARLGWNRERSRDAHHWFVNHQVAAVPFQHQVEGFLEFAKALGIATDQKPVWNFPIDEKDRQWANEHLPGSEPWLLISPCSSHPRRNWSGIRYAQVADHAIAALGMRVAIVGGPSDLERTTAAEIEQHMSQNVVNLVGQDTLKQSVAALQRASVVISPDSGPAHIASAVGTPVIGLFAATWSKRSGPFNSLEHCVDRFPEAARTFRNSEPENLRWGTRIEEPGVMDLIETDDVIQRLEHIRTQV